MNALTLPGRRTGPAAYDPIASEYYDPLRHPTCHDFLHASVQLLRSAWPEAKPGLLVEVGAGCAVSLDLARAQPPRRWILSDGSAAMLAHGRHRAGNAAHCLISDAAMLPLTDHSVDLLVASLGDPYALPGFWREARRLLSPGGGMLFTTPSMGWAARFRPSVGEPGQAAEFVVGGRHRVLVPSYVLEHEAQERAFHAAGLRLELTREFRRRDFPAERRLSPKIETVCAPDDPVVTLYMVSDSR